MIFFLRVLAFLLRFAIWIAYSILQFVGKPGSRLIIPLALGALMYANRIRVEALADALIYDFIDRELVADRWMLDALLAGGLVAFTGAYYVSSRILHVVMSAFPTITRPLSPQRRLVPTSTEYNVAVVRVAVPPLPRRARSSLTENEAAAADATTTSLH
jgi:hypothetical protein